MCKIKQIDPKFILETYKFYYLNNFKFLKNIFCAKMYKHVYGAHCKVIVLLLTISQRLMNILAKLPSYKPNVITTFNIFTSKLEN